MGILQETQEVGPRSPKEPGLPYTGEPNKNESNLIEENENKIIEKRKRTHRQKQFLKKCFPCRKVCRED